MLHGQVGYTQIMDKRGTSPRSTEPLKPARPVTRVFHDLSGWPSRLIPFKDVYDMFCPKETLAMFHHSGSPVHTHVHIYCICIQYTLVKLPKLWAPVTSRWNPPIFYLDHDHCLNLSSEGKLNWLLSSNVNRITVMMDEGLMSKKQSFAWSTCSKNPKHFEWIRNM